MENYVIDQFHGLSTGNRLINLHHGRKKKLRERIETRPSSKWNLSSVYGEKKLELSRRFEFIDPANGKFTVWDGFLTLYLTCMEFPPLPLSLPPHSLTLSTSLLFPLLPLSFLISKFSPEVSEIVKTCFLPIFGRFFSEKRVSFS